MINNFDKDFFSKNNRIKLCSIVLTGMMVASPFIVKGMVDKAISDLEQHNEPIVVQEEVQEEPQEENTSRIYIDYEGEYDYDNGIIIVVEEEDAYDYDGETEIVAMVTPNADDRYVDLPAGKYIVAGQTSTYEIELDGENDYNLTVNYQDGTITNSNENINKPTHTR